MYRFSHNSLPDCFREYFVEVINKHKHLTRSSTNNFYVPRKKCAKGQSGLNYLGPRLWLEIPDNIKKKNTMKSFTVSYKKLLIESYDVDCWLVEWYFIFGCIFSSWVTKFVFLIHVVQYAFIFLVLFTIFHIKMQLLFIISSWKMCKSSVHWSWIVNFDNRDAMLWRQLLSYIASLSSFKY